MTNTKLPSPTPFDCCADRLIEWPTADGVYQMVWTIYHNPRCSKSCATLSLLQQHGVEPAVVDYLANPLDASTLRRLLTQLQLPAKAILRETEPAFVEQHSTAEGLSDDAIIALICQQPVLLQRPIISNGQHAVLGRPPENVLALLP